MTDPALRERRPSLWEDLLEIFYAPKAVFERRRETPAFGLALLLFAILLVVLTVAFQSITEPVFDAELKRSMAQAMKQNPQLTPEMTAQWAKGAQKFVYVGVGFYGLVIPLMLGILLWFVGKLLDSKAQIGQAMMVAVYAMYPRVIEAIVNAVQLLVMPEDSITSRFSLSLGPGRFLNPDTQQLLLAVVGRIDVFTIWITVLMGIGIMVMGRISKEKAIIAATIIWAIGAIPAVWGAIRAG